MFFWVESILTPQDGLETPLSQIVFIETVNHLGKWKEKTYMVIF